jgi:hypothetical protein
MCVQDSQEILKAGDPGFKQEKCGLFKFQEQNSIMELIQYWVLVPVRVPDRSGSHRQLACISGQRKWEKLVLHDRVHENLLNSSDTQ